MSPSFAPFFENVTIDQGVDEDYIFEMTTSTNELAKEFINKELLICRRFQGDTKHIKCVVQ
jgi:hypothetical protein